MDVYYHKKCYSAFTYTYQAKDTDAEIKEVEDPLINCFFRKIELRVVSDREAFLLTELMQDVKEKSEEFGLKAPPIRLNHTYQLKKMLTS